MDEIPLRYRRIPAGPAQPRLDAKDKNRIRARDRNEVIKAQLRLQPCEICGATPAERHHIDYSDPERVMWLCKLHHEQTHSQFGRPAPVDWMADIRAAVARIEARRLAARSRDQDVPEAEV